jgi:hypothetical protein
MLVLINYLITCRAGKEYGRKQRKLIQQKHTNIINDGTGYIQIYRKHRLRRLA